MPSRRALLARALVAIVAVMLVVVSTAAAGDPPTTPGPIHSIGFGTGDTTSLQLSADALGSEPPALAYWGPITAMRRGTTGSALWCAQNQISYPYVSRPTLWPFYPEFRKELTANQQFPLTSTTPVQLQYTNFGSPVTTIVVKSADGTIEYKATEIVKNPNGTIKEIWNNYVVEVTPQGYTTVRRGVPSRIVSGDTVKVSYKWPVSGTRALAELSLPELSNYYRSWLSFYYNMPSRGAADAASFGVHWYETGDSANKESHFSFPLTTSTGWLRQSWELSTGDVPLSRTSGQVEFRFHDFAEGAGQSPKNGQGPTVDDIAVTGYKYGPVPVASIAPSFGSGVVLATDNAKASYVDQAAVTLGGQVSSQVNLTWAAPPRALGDSTPDSRSIAYRVWRKTGTGAWSELTSSRLTTRAHTDAPLPGTHTYAIQAWDPGTAENAGYGEITQKNVTVPLAGTISAIEYSLDGAANVTKSGSSAVVNAGPTPTSHTLTYRVQSDSGTWSAKKTVTFTVKKSTKLSVSTPSTSSYRSVKVAGYLKDADSKPLSGQKVTIQYSYDQKTWATVATQPTTTSTGYFSLTHTPYKKTYYRAVFAGNTSFAPSTSAVDYVLPRVYVTAPRASLTQYYGRYYTTYGFLKPKHTAGTKPVQIKAYRYQSGKWVLRKTFYASASNYSTYTKYSVKAKLPYRGKWKLRAYHAADSLNAATYSAYSSTITVK